MWSKLCGVSLALKAGRRNLVIGRFFWLIVLLVPVLFSCTFVLKDSNFTEPDSWLPFDQLGHRVPPYLPTWGDKEFINENHRYYANCQTRGDGLVDLGITGWLRKEDALKLYELAFYSTGDILEIGCHQGLATSVMAQAVKDVGMHKTVTSVDLVPSYISAAARNLTARNLQAAVRFSCAEATTCCRELVSLNRRFGFVFVDHSHTYEDVLALCKLLPDLLNQGGFCLFHDFNDGRNYDPAWADYGVAQAVVDGLDSDSFGFYGIFGCTALYRKL